MIKKILLIILLFVFTITLGACAFFYFGRISAPTGSQWSKDGYTLEETQAVLLSECWRDIPSGHSGRDEIIFSHNCMLNRGFDYMEDAYDVVGLGYLPLNSHVCFKGSNSFMYSTPGCISYREKHPKNSWFKVFF
ncbi:hypothetical protein ABMA57_02465 [Saccharospirillum sp. HFRX-1]|uniref:hypothetical protein n=1 Tax=unclassified Saccharospirillum TaxID=2633430 RepID=UPI00370FE44B